jgi:hypothetical protein
MPGEELTFVYFSVEESRHYGATVAPHGHHLLDLRTMCCSQRQAELDA